MNYEEWIGQPVRKKQARGNAPKPFKSGLKMNIVKGIIDHPILHIPAFTFQDDDSYVECRRCQLMNRNELVRMASRQLDEALIDLETKYKLRHGEATFVLALTAKKLESRECLDQFLNPELGEPFEAAP